MIESYNIINQQAKSMNSLRFKVIATIITVFLIGLVIVFTPFVFHGIRAASYVTASISEAKILLANVDNKDWQQAVESSESIEANLSKLNTEISGLGLISKLPKLKNDFKVGQQFIVVAQSLVGGYAETFKIFATIEQAGLTVDPNILLENKEVINLISQNKTQLALAKKQLEIANASFSEIDTNDFSGFFASYLIQAHDVLGQVLASTNIGLPVMGLLPDLLGYNGEKHYLLILENNMELRPTGGFIGSYGIITVESGKIKNLITDDVYNLDKLSEGKLLELAPEPMLTYNRQKYWYMRDANWYAGWPDSANKIVEFFHIERQNANLPDQRIDGVIAITPDFIANLLAVLGPINSHGIVFSENNFAMDLEEFVEGGFEAKNIPYDERKSIIGDLSKILISRIENTTAENFSKLWLAFKKNIDEKNILVYIFDNKLQQYFSDQNWAGEIRQTNGDYLMLIDSNFASLKTDAVMERSIKRSLSLNEAGDLMAHLEITYKHNGQFVKDLITRYRTYAKVYVPAGSWFESGSIKDETGETVLNMSSDLTYGNEYNKAYATYFVIIEPGKSKTVILNYKLPKNILDQYNQGTYNLLVQKQPGTIGHKLGIDLNLSKEISAYKAAILPNYYGKTSIGWESDLTVDREYKIKFN
ncbi:DUF4012 domain-containing protein [Candidatus Falkowbacteria bacterium]|uniref:DUF4012 domain-containing protein n=1 Tax=Candidatus Buchananbacteria bacterium CG10_big_fil_rev_8_21_14_0_10_33_19 TaxID=1974525 RepID=A0A2H0W5G6_9BACT|nr:DUF4012 domain-containing protein [Candidatus Falkowbacteria bacterium]PIS05880.1 MAG: hypothetical protein COT80_03880 [Candidatus Buchananbacteria bacterium CG10_big_fil_rev_8_21_14_0_10_33_19]